MKNSTHTLVLAMSAIVAFAGVEHGIGEILQGSTAPASVWILSWPDSELFRSVDGEPAMTVIPNLLVTGILSILVSLAYFVWARRFVGHKHGGLVLILLSVPLLLFGGGIFPPVMGVLTGLVATRAASPLTWWRRHLPSNLAASIGTLWPWLLALCVCAWLLLFPGSIILDYFLGLSIENVMMALILAAFGLLLLTALAGFARDSIMTAAG